MAGINTNNTQWGNFQSDDVKNLNDIYRWIKKLESVISNGFQGDGGWTDDGTTIRLTTPTDSVGIGTASPLTKLHVLHDTGAVALFQSSTDSYVKIQSGNNLGTALLLTDGTDEATVGFDGATGTLVIDAGGDGVEIASSGVVTIPNLGGSGTGIVAVSNTGVLGFTSIDGFTIDGSDNMYAGTGTTGTGGNTLAIGVGALVDDTNGLALGNQANAAAHSTAVGTSSQASTNSIALGYDVTAVSGSIVIGHGVESDSSGQLIIGSTSFLVTDFYINNVTSTTPASVKINPSGGAGTDITGGNLTIAGGKPTGAGLGGHVIIQTAAAGASGTTLRSLSTIAEFTDDAKIGFFGVTPVVRQTELTDELTTITHTAPGTPDYALQNLVQNTGFGFATADEGNTLLSVVANLQARVNELETKLTAYGLLIDAD